MCTPEPSSKCVHPATLFFSARLGSARFPFIFFFYRPFFLNSLKNHCADMIFLVRQAWIKFFREKNPFLNPFSHLSFFLSRRLLRMPTLSARIILLDRTFKVSQTLILYTAKRFRCTHLEEGPVSAISGGSRSGPCLAGIFRHRSRHSLPSRRR